MGRMDGPLGRWRGLRGDCGANGQLRRRPSEMRRREWRRRLLPLAAVAAVATAGGYSSATEAEAAHRRHWPAHGEQLGFMPMSGIGCGVGPLARSPATQPQRRKKPASLPHARRPPSHPARLERFWAVADRLSTLVCGVLGASIAFNYAASCASPAVKIGLAAGSAFVTTFGGSTQSEVLRWVVGRAAGSDVAEPPKFAWRRLGAHAWAFSGFVLACALECTGNLGTLLGAACWQAVLSLNMAVIVASAVIHSGWCSPEGCWCAAPSIRGPVSWLGTFLYSCGGGLWRDLLAARQPVALAGNFLLPLAAGVLLCRGLRDLGDAHSGRGDPLVVVAGMPAVYCLFETCV